jgi:hypothetical protein
MKKTIHLLLFMGLLFAANTFAQLNLNRKSIPVKHEPLLAFNPEKKTSIYKAGSFKPVSSAYGAPGGGEKCFEKGSIVIDGGIAFALYKTKIHQEISIPSAPVYKHDTTDAAGGPLYTIRGEYGVTDWFGAGLRFGYTNFIQEKDSVTGTKPKSTGIDFGVAVNFHLIKTRRFEMPVSMSFGYGGIKIRQNDTYDTQARGKGTGFTMALMPRIYFTDHIGMNFVLGYGSYNYGNIQYSNKDDNNLNKTWNTKVTLKGSGAQIGIGLQVKI